MHLQDFSKLCITLLLENVLLKSQEFWVLTNLLKVLSSLRDFLAIESPLKMMKNAFYLTSKALFIHKIFKFLSWHFGHVAKWLEKKNRVNFKIYGITVWLSNNCNTHIDHVSRSEHNQTMKFGQLIEYNMRNYWTDTCKFKIDKITYSKW